MAVSTPAPDGVGSRVVGAILGLLVFFGCLFAGGVVLGLGHWLIGMILLLGSLPGAIVAWMKWNDRGF